MPRRTLLALTALVLALHWLVLQGVPLSWESRAAPNGKVFSTRSVAAAPTQPAPSEPASPAAAPAEPRPPAAKPRSKPVADRPRPAAAQRDEAPQPPETGEATATDALPGSTDGATAGSADGAAEVAAAPADPMAQAPAAAASAQALPASAATAAAGGTEGSAVDITPPGGGTDKSASTTPPPVKLPAPVRLAFDVAGQAKKFDYQARAELLWQHDGAKYEARQEISAFLVGSRTQRSTGMVTDQGLQPERFGDRNRSERAAHFDYAKGRVTFSANTPEAAIGPGVQDRLSVFIQLAGLLAATPDRFVPGTQLTLTTVSATAADRWTFTVEAAETLTLPLGNLPTLKLQRLHRRDYDQKAELWLAPSMGYLPVRIKITQANGDFADLKLRSSSAP